MAKAKEAQGHRRGAAGGPGRGVSRPVHRPHLLVREFPPEAASQPIISYDTRSVGLDIRNDLQAIARDILNSQTSEDPRRDLDQIDEQVSGLEASDQVSGSVALLTLYLRKLHQLAATTRP